MSQPFYQPARQNFSSSQSMQQPQGGFGGFGGGQMPQQNWGGGQGFSGFGGGQGFNFGGGQAFGGFQQQQFNPFQGGFGGGFSPFQGGFGGGFGGGFQPQGFGGFNPMFGGIGGLGFNPMMGQGFGMPMQGMRDPRVDMLGQQFGFASEEPMRAIHQLQSGLTPLQPQQQPQQNPFEDQQRQLRTQMEALPEYQAFQAAQNAYGAKQQELPEFIAAQNAQRALENSDALKSIQQKQQELQRMQARPMYGGLGSLGFNPMMGPQFGMPMTRDGAFSLGMLTPQQRQQMFTEQEQRRQTENAQREELKSKFGAGIFEGEGRGGGLRFMEDYNESPELSAFTKTPEYQRALQNRQFDSSATNSVDMAFKDWLYKNKDTLSSGALGFMTDATKAKNAARDAEITRRASLTPQQRMAEDQKMYADTAQEVHKAMRRLGMPMQFDPDQVSSAPTYAYGPQEAQAAANASRLQYGY